MRSLVISLFSQHVLTLLSVRYCDYVPFALFLPDVPCFLNWCDACVLLNAELEQKESSACCLTSTGLAASFEKDLSTKAHVCSVLEVQLEVSSKAGEKTKLPLNYNKKPCLWIIKIQNFSLCSVPVVGLLSVTLFTLLLWAFLEFLRWEELGRMVTHFFLCFHLRWM